MTLKLVSLVINFRELDLVLTDIHTHQHVKQSWLDFALHSGELLPLKRYALLQFEIYNVISVIVPKLEETIFANY